MTIPWKDPIVEETRSAAQQIEMRVGNDLHAYFEHLRSIQQRYAARVVEAVGGQPGTAAPDSASAPAS